MNLELYQYYTRGEIFDAIGGSDPTEAEGWFLSSNKLVGLLAIGERSPDSHFCDHGRFHWHGRDRESVPAPLQSFKQLSGAYLFVKSPATDRYVYVCQIQHVGMYGGGPGRPEVAMDITPRIPTELLHELGGLYLHPNGDAAMNRAVGTLRSAATPGQRFEAFQDLVEYWRGPLQDQDALVEADLSQSKVLLPEILKRLYCWAGACGDVMSAGYLSIRKPSELSVDDYGYVAFCVECQWCGNYYIRQDGLLDADPEVYADECGDTRQGKGYHATGIGLSQFLWAYYIAFNIYGGPISYTIELKSEELPQVAGRLDPLPVLAIGSQSNRAIQAYRPEIGYDEEAQIFARDGVMGCLLRATNSGQLYMLSKTQSAIDQFVASLSIDSSRLQDTL